MVRELEAREAELRARVAELEREGTDLAQRLRMRDRELDTRSEELAKLREAVRGGAPRSAEIDGKPLSGDYDEDVDRLTTTLAIERKRASFLEDQARSLLSRLENSDRRSAEATAAIAQMRDALTARDDKQAAQADSLVAAEARIASAENRLNALLAETSQVVEQSEGRAELLLADKLSLEAEVEKLRKQVSGVESTLLADWDTERLEEAYLREKLNDIAASVSRLVYAVDTETAVPSTEESLFDRVQRFADDGEGSDALPVKPAKGNRKGGSVTDRMAALREIQGR